jgi:hypothetical protein
MNKLDSLSNYFKIHNINISEIQQKSIHFTIQILHLFFNIGRWYLNNKSSLIIIYKELFEYDILDIYNIPFSLCNKYITNIYPLLNKKDRTAHSLINSIEHLKRYNKYFNAIYINNSLNSYIIFIYEDEILVININTLDVVKSKYIENNIIEVCKLLGNIFSYQFIHIGMNNMIYYQKESEYNKMVTNK